jgi:hypothetical protein
MIKSISVTLSSEGGIIPGVVLFVTSSGTGNTNGEEVGTLSPPEEEITAGAELLVHHILIIIPDHDEKITIPLYPSFLDCLQGFLSPLTIMIYQGLPVTRSERSGTMDIIPDGIHPMYLQGGALSIKVQP